MRRALVLVLLVAGAAPAADRVQRTRDVPLNRPQTIPVPPRRTQAPVSPQALSAPVVKPFVVSPSLSALAPVPSAIEPLEATQTGDPEPFSLHGDNRVSLKVEHQFTRADARERVVQLLNYWSRRFGVKSEWRGYRVFLSGRVLGIDIQALFDVTDHDVLAHASDPGTVLRGSAEAYVEKKLRKYLSPTYDDP